jgi:hypothetical protein
MRLGLAVLGPCELCRICLKECTLSEMFIRKLQNVGAFDGHVVGCNATGQRQSNSFSDQPQ